MFYRKSLLTLALLMAGALPLLAQHNCATCPAARAAACRGGTASADTLAGQKTAWVNLPGYNKKAWIGKELYFTYAFDKKNPKMGPAVLKVQLFDKNGKKIQGWEITGRTGMPSMSGAHDAEAAFRLNKKGDYLLPVNFVMPGEWEVKLTFRKDGKILYLGSFRLNV